MDKLQLYITMSQDGFNPLRDFNPDKKIKDQVCDLSSVICQIDYPTNEKAIFYLLKYTDTGYFIIILRTIPDIPGNHLATWIFVPYDLQIADADLGAIVDFIVTKVSNSQITSRDLTEIQQAFEQEYASNLLAPIFPKNTGKEYAFRFYGPHAGVSLTNLLGQFRYQTAYLPTAGVVFVDENIAKGIDGQNLTLTPLDDMAVLLPPASGAIDGYKPKVYDQPFDIPYYVPITRTTDVLWTKDDAPAIIRPIKPDQSEMRCPDLVLPTPQAPTPALPQEPTPAQLTEPEPEPAPAADNTETKTDTETAPTPDTNPAPIPNKRVSDLPERQKVYHFKIPTKSVELGSMIEFEIVTNSDIDGSPIDGYEPTDSVREGTGRCNQLMYTDRSKASILAKVLYAIAGCIVGAAITFVITYNSEKKTSANLQDEPIAQAVIEEPQTLQDTAQIALQPTETDNQAQPASQGQNTAEQLVADVSLAAAIHYLDNTRPAWDKEDMEQFPDLKGLYDDMNNINRERLVKYWGPKLKDSRRFQSVVEHSKNNKKPRKNPYNKPDKTSISIQDYLNTIDP